MRLSNIRRPSAARLRQVLAGLLIVPFLQACSGLIDLPGSDDAPQIYQLTMPSTIESGAEKGDLRVLVEEPDTSRAIDTDRIALHPSPVELKYYAKSKWTDRVPRLIQSLLVQSLEAKDQIEFAGRSASGTSAPYLLSGTLSNFHADYSGGGPEIVVTLKLNLVDQRTAKILQSQIFESRVEAKRDQTKEVVIAFNEATQSVISQATTGLC